MTCKMQRFNACFFIQNTVEVEILVGLIFGILSNDCIWQYVNLEKFKVLLHNLKCSLCHWRECHQKKLQNFNPSQNSAQTVVCSIV